MMTVRPFTLLAACGTALVVSTVLSNSSAFGQGRDVTIRDVVGAGSRHVPFDGVIEPSSRSQIAQKVNELRQQLKAAQSTNEKDHTKNSLREALVEYFDGDMQQRRAELDKLTSRSSVMSAALEKRAAAKEQLIDLQLKSFKYEAEGLGLFPSRPSGNGYGSGGGMS